MKLIINEHGVKFWYNNKKQKHHIFEPAIAFLWGDASWYRYGVLHRLDGPALLARHGDDQLKYWYWLGYGCSQQHHALLSNKRFFTKKVKI